MKPNNKPRRIPETVLGTTGNGYLWSHEQIVEIAGLIALRDLCLPGEAVRALYSLMGEGRLPRYSEALRNARLPVSPLVAVTDITTKDKDKESLRGHGPANRARRSRALEQARLMMDGLDADSDAAAGE